MKIKRLFATALTVGAIMLAGTAYADEITVVIDFDDNTPDDPFSYDFPTQGGESNSGNCPEDDTLDTPCAQLASGDTLVITVTPPPDTFDLMSFFWEYTGNQTGSVLSVSFLPEGTGTATYPAEVNAGTEYQMVDVTAITQITFANTTNSVVRLDGISLTYDDGLCDRQECPPPPPPPCDDPCEPPPPPPPCDGDDCQTVPEPGTLGLLGLGLLGLAARRRRTV